MAFERWLGGNGYFGKKKKITERRMGRDAGRQDGGTHLVSLGIRSKTMCQVPALNSGVSAQLLLAFWVVALWGLIFSSLFLQG